MFVLQFPRNSISCTSFVLESIRIALWLQVFPALLLANKEGTINDCQYTVWWLFFPGIVCWGTPGQLSTWEAFTLPAITLLFGLSANGKATMQPAAGSFLVWLWLSGRAWPVSVLTLNEAGILLTKCKDFIVQCVTAWTDQSQCWLSLCGDRWTKRALTASYWFPSFLAARVEVLEQGFLKPERSCSFLWEESFIAPLGCLRAQLGGSML